MTGINLKDKKYIITFKPKNERPNSRDDKFEIFRNIVGLADISDEDILDLSRFVGPTHMHDPIRKTKYTVTDINAYENPTIHARLSPDQANRLRKDPNVLFVKEDYIVHKDAELVTWQYPELGADRAQRAPLSTGGSGVAVAVIDTGVDATHVDLKDRVKVNQNFVADNLGTKGGDEHGSHVAGIIAASFNGEGTVGIAPNSNIWNLRAADGEGNFNNTDLGEALEYARMNKPHIVNMSFGGLLGDAATDAYFTNLYNGGILLFGSAGNTGRQEFHYPGSFTNVNGISALGPNSTIADFSTWSNTVDFTAPGTAILSCGFSNRLWGSSGTSMSCPAVAGVAALCVSVYKGDTACGPPYVPGATRNPTIEAVMKASAVKRDSEGAFVGASPKGTRDIFYGWGMPQAHIAVAALKQVAVPAIASFAEVASVI